MEILSQESLGSGAGFINEKQRETLMEYLRKNSDSAVGEELRASTKEEVELAEKLLGLNLPANDSASSRHFKYSDSNFIPDVEFRDKSFAEAGLDKDKYKIQRHNIIINNGQYSMSLKIMNLLEKIEDAESPDGINFKMVEGGVIFLGKLIFEKGQEKYLNLTDEEIQKIKDYLES